MKAVATAWNRTWFAEGSLVALGVWRILALTIAAYATTYPSAIIMSYAGSSGQEIGHLWSPVYFIEILGMGPPSESLAHTLLGILTVAFVMAIVGLFTRTATLVVAVLGVFWWGLAYSFGQAHHEKISLAFALIVLPFSPCGARVSLDALIRRWRRRSNPQTSDLATWPIRVIQLSIAMTYLFAGGSKLMISGLEWMNGYTLQGIMSNERDPMAIAIANDVVIARAASIAVITLQATFPLVFLHRHLRWIYVPGTIAFHLGAWITMNPGPYYSLWLLTTVTFFRVDRIPTLLRTSWHQGHRVRVCLQLAALFAFVTLCIRIISPGHPGLMGYILISAGIGGAVALIAWIFMKIPVCDDRKAALAE